MFGMQHVSCFNKLSSLCLILCSQLTVPQTATHEIKYFWNGLKIYREIRYKIYWYHRQDKENVFENAMKAIQSRKPLGYE